MHQPSKLDRSLAADIVVFTIKDGDLKVLLVKRADSSTDPFAGMWALPGGFRAIGVDSTIEDTARRVLKAETGADAPYLEQLFTFSSDDRDPSGWVTSVAHFVLVPYISVKLNSGHGATEAKWVSVRDNTIKRPLAFDHKEIVNLGIERIRSKLQYTAIAGHLLGKEFTRPQLLGVYETILGCSLDRTHFYRSLKRSDVIESTGHQEAAKGHRPAELFRFKDGADTVLFFPRGLVQAATSKKS